LVEKKVPLMPQMFECRKTTMTEDSRLAIDPFVKAVGVVISSEV
jgi:hypothetical protein